MRKVFVLAVLHDIHNRTEGYTYWHILKLLNAYQPDLICIEVGPRRFERGDFRIDSPEKWGIGLMWGLDNGVPVAPMDTDELPDLDERRAEAVREFEQRTNRSYEEAASQVEQEAWELVADAGGLDRLIDTYEHANSEKTQEVFRRMHERSAQILGDGPLTGHWGRRNATMVQSIVTGAERHDAARAIALVGAEHKYALDALLNEESGVAVIQLRDFLSHPIELSPEERAAFARGADPVRYPSDVMFLHRKLHGGEPDSYLLRIPQDPDAVDLAGTLERIRAGLDLHPDDPELLYYRGMHLYVLGLYEEARADFRRSAAGPLRLMGIVPVHDMALLRCGQMSDLLGQRSDARAAYGELKEHGHSWIRDRAAQFFEEPFALSEEGESG